MWIEEKVVVRAKDGLHARPARMVWEKARRFAADLRIRKGALDLDAKSIFDIMRLNATHGTELTVCARGDDAREAVRTLVRLIGSVTE
ncbi:MAG TPA: HPr family phosphocarrier protein [Planctomycetota bacterium]|nr:HPr family phosphocarrier protein [Planctomycetota bacterium]HUV39210.1 HPr family phosphocarrier protein [Planctomycetota bacterium]